MKRTTAGLALIALLAVALFVWPTPYRYLTWQAEGMVWPVRVSRLTGQAELLSRVGWLPMAPAADPLGKIEQKLGTR